MTQIFISSWIVVGGLLILYIVIEWIMPHA